MIMDRTCRKCGKILTEKNWNQKRKSDYICRNCLNEYNRVFYHKNKERRIAWQREYRKRIRGKIEEIIGKNCVVCGHLKSDHVDTIARGHGGCRKCPCNQFTWVRFIFEGGDTSIYRTGEHNE